MCRQKDFLKEDKSESKSPNEIGGLLLEEYLEENQMVRYCNVGFVECGAFLWCVLRENHFFYLISTQLFYFFFLCVEFREVGVKN